MHFKTAFGSDLVQNFKFIHYLKKAATYSCRVDKVGPKVPQLQPVNPKDPKISVVLVDFTIDVLNFNAPPSESNDGIEVGVNIKYEPSALGDSRAILVLTSPDAGEYQCLLIGQSSAPVPKGPFKIGAKSPPIDFKNPFFDSCEFIIRIDNPSFTTGAKSPIKVDVIIILLICC